MTMELIIPGMDFIVPGTVVVVYGFATKWSLESNRVELRLILAKSFRHRLSFLVELAFLL